MRRRGRAARDRRAGVQPGRRRPVAPRDVAFSGAYNLAQHQGWEWDKKAGKPLRWDLTWYAVVLSVIALPLTYLPIATNGGGG